MYGTVSNAASSNPASMKLISTPTLSLEKIRSKGRQVVAAVIGAPG